MAKVVQELTQFWRSRLLADYPQQPPESRESILRWLLGEESDRLESVAPQALTAIKKGMEYRYGILQQRYLNSTPSQAYLTLIDRLSSLVILRQKIRTWVSLSRDRQCTVAEVLQEVIQEMLNSDHYLQGQLTWIAQCTPEKRLRNSLLFTTLEEYSLRSIRHQPLLTYRFFNFLQCYQRGGVTQVPQKQALQIMSSEIGNKEREAAINLLNLQSVIEYCEKQRQREQQSLNLQVKTEFATYLRQKVGEEAVQWLGLYLQQRSPEEIATYLNLSIKQVYRLREKVGYHAVSVFALKDQPELVAEWLEISLRDHNLGLTPRQWKTYWESLNHSQRQVLHRLELGQSLEAIADALNWKKSQVMKEWSQLYLTAQAWRNHQ